MLDETNLQDWYDRYPGPKSLTLDGLIYVCMIGYNVHVDGGGVTGKQAIGRDRWDQGAILKAYREWRQFSEEGQAVADPGKGEEGT